jgi:hypothetical protein
MATKRRLGFVREGVTTLLILFALRIAGRNPLLRENVIGPVGREKLSHQTKEKRGAVWLPSSLPFHVQTLR